MANRAQFRRTRGEHGQAAGVLGREDGYALIMVALLLIPLVVFTAFAVDLGAWYARTTKIQRAADAASLAGVVFQPDFATAKNVALQTVTRNGFGGSEFTTTVTSVGTQELKVTITDNSAPQYFSGVVVRSETLTRSATAEYVLPVPLGSPKNALGNDPDSGVIPNLWVNTAGYLTNKSNGDEETAGDCSGAPSGSPYANCGTTLGSNADYNAEGYLFKVTVPAAAAGAPLDIQVYDPSFDYEGDQCTANQPTTAELATLASQYGAMATRWNDNGGGSPNHQFCPGDQYLNQGNLPTTYTVREPGSSPLVDPASQNPVCGITFDPEFASPGGDAVDSGAAEPIGGSDKFNSDGSFNPGGTEGSGDFFKLLDTSKPGWNLAASTASATGPVTGRQNMPFYKYFHQWVTVCHVAVAKAGSYVLQVQTNIKGTTAGPITTALSSDTDPGLSQVISAPQVGGHNRYSIRVGSGAPVLPTPPGAVSAPSGSFNSAGYSVAAIDHLPIYVNGLTATPTSFYLAKVGSIYHGHTLTLTFWDMADIGCGTNAAGAGPPNGYICKSAASVQVVAPDGVNNPSPATPTIGACSFEKNDAVTSLGAATTDSSTCTMSNIESHDYNGNFIIVKIPLGNTYSCTDGAALGCWFKVNIGFTADPAYPNGVQPADTTTWSASVDGDPVHLAA